MHRTKYAPSILFILLAILPYLLNAKEPEKLLSKSAEKYFLENKGQITDQFSSPRNDIQYKLDGEGFTVFISSTGIHYQWYQGISEDKKEHSLRDTTKQRVAYNRMDVSLIGARNVQAIAAGCTYYSERYFLEGVEGRVTANAYTSITFPDVYPNIDWKLYIQDGNLKYDFIVKAGGDPKQIKLRYEGTDELHIDNGALTASTHMGEIKEAKPFSYEQEGARAIVSKYTLDKNILSFDIEPYSGTLVIDPVLEWATYYGGSGDELACAVVSDNAGYIYFSGETYSYNNIATVGSFQDTFGAVGEKGFCVKFDASGNRVWGTYFPSPMYDMVYDGEDLCLAGITFGSSNLGTPGTYKPTLNGNSTILIKFDTSGSLVWGTHFEPAPILLMSLTTDDSKNIFLTGRVDVYEANIATPGSHQQMIGSTHDAFLAKFSSGGQLYWSTYYGGNDEELDYYSTWSKIIDVACDSKGNVYMCGNTESSNNIATPGAHQTALAPGAVGNNKDIFIVKFDALGNRKWGTYYGGVDRDEATSIICDEEGYVYVGGYTQSQSGIASPGSFQDTMTLTMGTSSDAFLVKFNSDGVKVWGTYYGGEGWEYISALSLDMAGNIIAGGITTSLNGVTTPGTFPSSDYNRGLVVKFDKNGNRLWGTYFGGILYDIIRDVTVDTLDNIYLTGTTGSLTGFATPNAFQPTFGGYINGAIYGDGFLAKVSDPDTAVYIKSSLTANNICPGTSTVNVAYGTIGTFNSGNVFTVQLSDATGSFANAINIGSIASATGGTISATLPTGLLSSQGYKIRIIADNIADTSQSHSLNIYPANTTPSISITIQADSICSGDTATFLANASVAGANPEFEWMVNGITVPNAVGAFYITDSLQQGDIVSCVYRSSLPCIMGNDSAHSNNILMTVFDIDSPSVSIIHLPAVSIVSANTAITYYSTVLNGGTNTTYQWKRNGVDIPNATADTLVLISGIGFKNGDSISLEIKSNRPCITRDSAVSNKISVQVSLGVDDVPVISGIVNVYPNPTNGHFTIDGYCPESIERIDIELFNSLGQEVYESNINVENGRINKQIDLSHLPDGVYWLHTEGVSLKLIIRH